MHRFHRVAAWVVVLTIVLWAGPALAWGPYLLDLNKRGVTVVWEGTGSGTIEYGTNPDNLDMSLPVTGDDRDVFRGKIECLKPDTQYYYRVSSGGFDSGTYNFVTGVEADTPFWFIAYGDTRTNKDDHELVVDAVIGEAPPFVLQSGDLVEIAVFVWEWNDFFEVEEPLLHNTAAVPIMGNHEMWGGQVFFQRYFDTPDHSGTDASMYAFQYGNTYFINLDVTRLFVAGTEQYNWFVEQLELASSVPSIKHCVVQAHFPPYSASNHGSDIDVLSFRNTMQPLFEQYGVDMVVGGHDHNYQHNLVNGVHYMVSGGGGAPQYGVDPEEWTVAWERTLNYMVINVVDDTMTITAKRPDGTIIEEFDIVNDFGGAATGDELPVPCADGDWDEDGLTDGAEYGMCTDPYVFDSDGDTFGDGEEVEAGTDPCDENSFPTVDDDDDNDDNNDDNDDDNDNDDNDDDDNDDDNDDNDNDNDNNDVSDDDTAPVDDDDDNDDDSGCGC